MTRYFLDLIADDTHYTDSEGTEWASLDDALLEARRVLSDVLRDGTPAGTAVALGPLCILVRSQDSTATFALELTLTVTQNASDPEPEPEPELA